MNKRLTLAHIAALLFSFCLSAPHTFAKPAKKTVAPKVRAPETASIDPNQVYTSSFSKGACTQSETWLFTQKVRPKWQQDFNSFLAGRLTPAASFSQALGVRRVSEDVEVKTFSEYWVSRSLYNAKLYHIAYSGFTNIATREVTPETAGPQAAALECLSVIQSEYPTIQISMDVARRLPEYSKLKMAKAVNLSVWKAATTVFRDMLANASVSREEILAVLQVLQGSQHYEWLAQTFWAAKRSQHAETIRHAQQFLNQGSLPKVLERFTDPARILYATALYSSKKFEDSQNQLKLIKKSSNDLAHALSELSWAYLMDQKYLESIGTSINLQTGGLRKTFAPEAPMVMAMAFNELCQYPKAVEAVGVFRSHYAESYQWLAKWDRNLRNVDYYGTAIGFLTNRKPASLADRVPDKVVSEWVRSPLFISRQQEINLIFDERDYTKRLGQSGDKEQTALAQDILKKLREFRKKFDSAKAKLKPGAEMPPSILTDIENLRLAIAMYRNYRTAAPVWRSALKVNQDKAPGLSATLMKHINQDFHRLNTRMHRQLQEIAENNYFIEVEIYNGASQDMIWKNAYPEYEKVAHEMTAEERPSATRVWNWGKVSFSLDGDNEIWEDELGSFKADVYDNCENKEKYLAIKKQSAMEFAKRSANGSK